MVLSAKKDNYYELPGIGSDGGDDHQTPVEQETMEETGCKIEMAAYCIATVEEYRNDLHQTS